MKTKYRIKEAMQFLTFAFYPQTTLIACAVISVIVIVILGIVMAFIPQDSGSYNMPVIIRHFHNQCDKKGSNRTCSQSIISWRGMSCRTIIRQLWNMRVISRS